MGKTAGELGLPDCRGSWEAGLRLVRCQSWDDHSGIGRPRQVTSDGAALEEGGSWSGACPARLLPALLSLPHRSQRVDEREYGRASVLGIKSVSNQVVLRLLSTGWLPPHPFTAETQMACTSAGPLHQTASEPDPQSGGQGGKARS